MQQPTTQNPSQNTPNLFGQSSADETFQQFIYRIISPAMTPELAAKLVAEGPLERYFRRAFTHKTFYMTRAASQGNFDYEVLEKTGDRILAWAFQKWLFDIIGNEVTLPQPYSIMEVRLTGTDYLSVLCDQLGFSKWIRPAQEEGLRMTPNIKEDVFEAFIAAINAAADEFVANDFGPVLAKRWIYCVYNTFTRDKIDPRNIAMYVDARSQVNEIWSFNNWGAQVYKLSGDGKGLKDAGVRGVAAVNLFGPKVNQFPARFRGKLIGSGEGSTLDEAKENAAASALKFLEINFSDLLGQEVTFSGLETARLDKLLAPNPKLLAEVKTILKERSEIYQSMSIRKLRQFNNYVVQLRVKIDNIWHSGGRWRSETSEQEAIDKVFNIFVDKVMAEELV